MVDKKTTNEAGVVVSKAMVDVINNFELDAKDINIQRALVSMFQKGVEYWSVVSKETINETIEEYFDGNK